MTGGVNLCFPRGISFSPQLVDEFQVQRSIYMWSLAWQRWRNRLMTWTPLRPIRFLSPAVPWPIAPSAERDSEVRDSSFEFPDAVGMGRGGLRVRLFSLSGTCDVSIGESWLLRRMSPG